MTRVPTRQEALLRLALREREWPAQGFQIDHRNGRARVLGRDHGLIYPDSFFTRSAPLLDTPKRVRFLFRGHMTKQRRAMLKPFEGPGSVVEASSWARRPDTKDAYDSAYFEALASAEFGLCPHHPDWPGPWDTLWTYRFIDCVMVGTIPVVFRATPLSPDFVKGFRFTWDNAGTFEFNHEDARHNRALAEEVFTL